MTLCHCTFIMIRDDMTLCHCTFIMIRDDMTLCHCTFIMIRDDMTLCHCTFSTPDPPLLLPWAFTISAPPVKKANLQER